MNKTEVINSLAEKNGLSKKDNALMLESLLSVISEALSKGEAVRLVGFGTFETRQRKAKTARNPRTSEPIHIPAATVPVFKAGATLREHVAAQDN